MVRNVGVLGLVLCLSFIGVVSADEKAGIHQACGTISGVIYNCTNGTTCQSGQCEMPNYLTGMDRDCQAEMKKRGYSETPAILRGYCYISSETPDMYEALLGGGEGEEVPEFTPLRDFVDKYPNVVELLSQLPQQERDEALLALASENRIAWGQLKDVEKLSVVLEWEKENAREWEEARAARASVPEDKYKTPQEICEAHSKSCMKL